ncbi:MAG: leucine-rich repeat protein, partial [Lachnospiraceae bacterium]|nr:leucine-rich repeat protein [Lachnospiraceae bacterium]
MRKIRKFLVRLLSVTMALAIVTPGVSTSAYAAQINDSTGDVEYVAEFETPFTEVTTEETIEETSVETSEEITEETSEDSENEDETVIEEVTDKELNIEKETTNGEKIQEIQSQIEKLNNTLERGDNTTPVSRGAWLAALLESFNLRVDQNMYGDEYFPDINADSAYYDTVMTAVVFGLVDVEAGDSFEPSQNCTREYAVYTLNKLLGFKNESLEYTFAEKEQVTYKDDIQVAIDKEWFGLSEGYFYPETAITEADKEALLNYAYEVCHQFEDEGDTGYEFLDSVINLDDLQISREIIEIDEEYNNTYKLTNVPAEIEFHEGDVFGFIDSGVPFAKKIVSVTKSEESYIVKTINAPDEEAFKTLDVAGINSIALSTISSADDSMDLNYIVGGTEENQWEDGECYSSTEDLQGKKVSAIEINQDYDIYSSKPIKDHKFDPYKGKYLSINVKLSDLEVDYEYKMGRIVRVALSGKMTLKYNVTIDVIGELGGPKEIVLGELLLGEFGVVTLKAEMEIQEQLTVTQVENFIIGAECSKASGARLIFNAYPDSAPTVETHVKMSAGLNLSYGINYQVLSANIYARAGIACRYDTCTYSDEKAPHMCENLKLWAYYQTGWRVKCSIGKIDLKDTFTDVNEFNSPVRINYHYEDEQLVEACTRAEDWEKEKSKIKYYTGKMSKFGLNGASSIGGVSVQSYEYTKADDGTAIITSYLGNSSTLNIPETIDGLTVSQIGNGDCIIPEGKRNSVRTVFMPDTVTTIGRRAFSKCTSIVSVEFSENLKTIKNYAFEGCSSLKSVDLPEGLTTLGVNNSGSAFANCTSLSQVYIPASLEEVHLGQFEGCPLDGSGVTFGDNITQIPNYLFAKSSIKKIAIPDTVTEIGNYAFQYCENLESIDFSDNTRTIGKYAFYGCTALKELQLPSGVTEIGSHTFGGCTSIEEVILPKGLTTLGSNTTGCVFDGCTSLSRVFIPKSLTTIGAGAGGCGLFSNCPLDGNDFEFEDGIEAIPEYLFEKSNIKEIVIPDTVKTIGQYAFSNCDSLTGITLSEGLQSIDKFAFYKCAALKNIQIPDSVTSLGTNIFDGCTYLDKFPVSVNSKLEGIPKYAFANTQNIKSVRIPKNVTVIAESAFNSSAVENVTIGESVSTIDLNAFKNCTKLVKVDMSTATSLKTFGNYVFDGCSKLESMELPSSVETVGTYVFNGCTALKSVKLSTGMSAISNYMFSGCSALTSIVVPFRVTKIGNYAFQNCSSLQTITIPASATSISTSAFSYKTTKIRGTSGSYAETFANENGYPFEAIEEEVTKITLPKPEITMKVGESRTVEIVVEPEDFTDAITFYFENGTSSILQITNKLNGTIKALAVGTETITIESDSGVVEHLTVKVVQPVTSVSISPTTANVEGGKTIKLAATVKPANAGNKTVVWSVADESIASVSEDGTVLGKKKGTTKVRATSCDNTEKYAEATVNVTSTVNVVNTIEELQSEHKYQNNTDETWVYTVTGAKGLDVTFDSQTTIHKTDFLYILDASDKQIGQYTGDVLQGKTIEVPGDTVKIRLKADESLNAWGFAVTSIEPHVTRYNITYHLNGGTNDASNPDTVIADTELNLENPTKNAYAFAGWFRDAKWTKEWMNGTKVTGNLVLYAKWTPTIFNITYVMNDTESEPAQNAADNPQEYTIESPNLVLSKPSREGYRFVGWFDSNDIELTCIETGTFGDIVIYAKWEEIPKADKAIVSITEKESGAVIPDSETNISVKRDVVVTLSTTTENAQIYYTLDGTQPSSTAVLYHAPITISDDVTLKAIVTAQGYRDSEVAEWNFTMSEPEGYMGDVTEEDVESAFDGDTDRIPHGIWASGIDEELMYTGSAKVFSDLRIFDYKTLLVEGKDYSVTYKNNKNAYTLCPDEEGFSAKNAPSLTITGKGAYTAKVTEYFTITPIDLTVESNDKQGYVSDIFLTYNAKKAQKPVPVVKYGATVLKKNTDYIYEYRNASDEVVTAIETDENHTMRVIGKGNYSGVLEKTIVMINPEDDSRNFISKAKVSKIPDQPYREDGYSTEDLEEIFANPDNKIVVKDGKNNVLTLGEDYQINEVLNAKLPGKATVVIGAADGSNYVGTKEITFNISGLAISKAKFVLEKTTFDYSGKKNEPVMQTAELKDKIGVIHLTKGTDYTLSYEKNVKAGTAYVIVTGIGRCTGTKKISFKILPREIDEATNPTDILVEEMESAYSYVKGGVQPLPVLKYSYTDEDGNDQTRILILGTDYSLSYKNNKKLAKSDEVDARGRDISPRVEITLKGDFKGKLVRHFAIEQQDISKATMQVADKVVSDKANTWKSKITITDINGKALSTSDYDAKTLKYTYTYDTANVPRIKLPSINVSAGDEIGKN